jgi:hypothetical protein
MITEMNSLTGKIHGEYTWCRVCERVELTGKWVENNWNCPYEGCTGSGLDAHSWSPSDWPCSVNANYPTKPEIGVRYQLRMAKRQQKR